MRLGTDLGLLVVALLGVALPQVAQSRSDEDARRYQLIALDDRAERAVLMDVAGATQVLRLDEETGDGLRLKSVAHDAVLIDVRYKSSGDVIAYRIALGESVLIRPLPEHRSGGVSVITTSLEVATPEVRTGAKDLPPSAARD